MFQDRKVSVVAPAYNEEEYVSEAVRDFKSSEYVDEVVIVDNNSTDRTAELARKAGARVVLEKRQGYGFACRRALDEARGEYIILVEPDGTFTAKDVIKFLAYSEDFDLILGTRTSKELIWKGANMGSFLRWGNVFLGRIITILHNGPHLSDVGCTYRLIKKPALKKIQKKFTVGSSSFSPEMMILAIKSRLKTVEIPVNYKPRKGKSKITGEKKKAFRLGLVMIKLILSYILK